MSTSKRIGRSTNSTPESELREALADLARTDLAMRKHPEPRQGPAFQAVTDAWERAYERAKEIGQTIEAEGP